MATDYPDNSTTVSHAVIETVATTKDIDSRNLTPLYYAVDPDALNALYRNGFDGRVEFQFADCEVMVDSDAQVHVSAGSGSNRSETPPSSERNDTT